MVDITSAVLAVQVLTYVVLGTMFCFTPGQWRLGVVQLLLAVVQAILYSGRMA